MSIVCATGFTEASSPALKVAAELAHRHHQPLWLAHVLPGGSSDPFGDRLCSAAEATLEGCAGELGREGLNVRTAALQGRLEVALGQFCREKWACLLLVGDEGPEALEALTTADVPLLVIRDHRPFIAWLRGEASLKVLLAIDHTSRSTCTLQWLGRLSEYGPIDLLATHLWSPRDDPESSAHRDFDHPFAVTISDETFAALRALPSAVKCRVHLEIGMKKKVFEQLRGLATEEKVDLVVIGADRHRVLGRPHSITQQVLCGLPVSVACVSTAMPGCDSVPSFHSAVVATDLSEAGNRAISCALGLLHQGTVHVLHVARSPVSDQQASGLLNQLAALLPPENEHLQVLVHVCSGDVVSEILKLTFWVGADVVCLGAKTHDGAIGSQRIMNEVMRLSGKPVLMAAADFRSTLASPATPSLPG